VPRIAPTVTAPGDEAEDTPQGSSSAQDPLALTRRVGPTDARVLAALAVTLWVALVATARAWGMYLEATGTRLILFTPPVIGGYRVEVPTGLLAVAALGVTLAVVLPRAVSRPSWRAVQAVTTGAAAAWWLGLALVDGTSGLTRGLHWDADYLEASRTVADGPGGFLRDYVSTLPGQPIALRGHPPGFALLFGALEAVGLGGERWAALVVVVASLSAVPAVLMTLRCIAGEDTARRAAPFLALAPAATWIVTSTDGLTMATGAWLLALLAIAGSLPTAAARRADLLAAGAGLVAAFAVLQSYGMALLVVPVLAVAWHQRRARPVLIASAVAAASVLVLGAWGFWWFAGLDATRHEYHTLEVQRPYEYFLFGNLGAWALALGPATAAGLALLRHRATWVVVGGGLAAALLADLSGMSSGEVERIWLPFTILVLPAPACLWTSRRLASAWLVAQVATAVAFTAVIGANW